MSAGCTAAALSRLYADKAYEFPRRPRALRRRDYDRRRASDQQLTDQLECPTTGRTAKIIDRTVPRGRDDPPRRVGWDAVALPPVACHDERLLDGVFGKG
jgi:hypothetical protein